MLSANTNILVIEDAYFDEPSISSSPVFNMSDDEVQAQKQEIFAKLEGLIADTNQKDRIAPILLRVLQPLSFNEIKIQPFSKQGAFAKIILLITYKNE